MYKDIWGLPIESGAATSADSARLAGMMALVNHPKTPDLREYFLWDYIPVRHPYANKYPENEPRVMSRDSLICLAAGLKVQQHFQHANIIYNTCKWFAPNNMDEQTKKWKIPDPTFAPQVRNHFRMASGLSGRDIGLWFLKQDIIALNANNPMYEQNQIQAMVLTAPREFVNVYTTHMKKWKEATKKYWVDDRLGYCDGEPELCDMIISTIEGAK